MPVEISTSANGAQVCRLTLTRPGIDAAVTGEGATKDAAVEAAYRLMQELAELAAAAVDAMSDGDSN